MMKAIQLKNGYFVSEIECQESPLEPGKYLIPKGAIITDKKPPIKTIDSEDVSYWSEQLNDFVVKKNPAYQKRYSIIDGTEKLFAPNENPSNEYTDIPKPEGDFIYYKNNWIDSNLYYKKFYSIIDGTEKLFAPNEKIPELYTEQEPKTETQIFWENDWIEPETKEQIETTRKYLGTKDKSIKSEAEIRDIIYQSKYDTISNNVKIKIENGFEINFIADLGIDADIKGKGTDGIKRRYPDTAQQIQDLKDQFFQHAFQTKLLGDSKKLFLQENYQTMTLDDLQNYNTEI